MVRREICRLVLSCRRVVAFVVICELEQQEISRWYLLADPETGMTSNDVRCQNVLLQYLYIYDYTYVLFSSDLIR